MGAKEEKCRNLQFLCKIWDFEKSIDFSQFCPENARFWAKFAQNREISVDFDRWVIHLKSWEIQDFRPKMRDFGPKMSGNR